jgi:hypothetical protein
MINEISGFQHVPIFERSLEGVCRCMPHISYLNSMDWFKGNFTGKPHNYFFLWKTMVSGVDFPFYILPPIQ